MTPLSLVIVSVCFGGVLGSFPICHFSLPFPLTGILKCWSNGRKTNLVHEIDWPKRKILSLWNWQCLRPIASGGIWGCCTLSYGSCPQSNGIYPMPVIQSAPLVTSAGASWGGRILAMGLQCLGLFCESGTHQPQGQELIFGHLQ